MAAAEASNIVTVSYRSFYDFENSLVQHVLNKIKPLCISQSYNPDDQSFNMACLSQNQQKVWSAINDEVNTFIKIEEEGPQRLLDEPSGRLTRLPGTEVEDDENEDDDSEVTGDDTSVDQFQADGSAMEAPLSDRSARGDSSRRAARERINKTPVTNESDIKDSDNLRDLRSIASWMDQAKIKTPIETADNLNGPHPNLNSNLQSCLVPAKPQYPVFINRMSPFKQITEHFVETEGLDEHLKFVKLNQAPLFMLSSSDSRGTKPLKAKLGEQWLLRNFKETDGNYTDVAADKTITMTQISDGGSGFSPWIGYVYVGHGQTFQEVKSSLNVMSGNEVSASQKSDQISKWRLEVADNPPEDLKDTNSTSSDFQSVAAVFSASILDIPNDGAIVHEAMVPLQLSHVLEPNKQVPGPSTQAPESSIHEEEEALINLEDIAQSGVDSSMQGKGKSVGFKPETSEALASMFGMVQWNTSDPSDLCAIEKDGNEKCPDQSLEERKQEDPEPSSRIFRSVMGQKKSTTSKMGSANDQLDKQAMWEACAKLLKASSAFDGTLKIYFSIGRILLEDKPNFGTERYMKKQASIDALKSVESLAFTNILTFRQADADFILNLHSSKGTRLFDANPVEKKVTFLFLAQNEIESFAWEMDGETFEVKAKNQDLRFGSVYWHFPRRSWDSLLRVDGDVVSNLKRDIQAFTDSIVNKPLLPVPNFQGTLPSNEFRLITASMTRTSRHLHSGHQTALEIIEHQRLELKRSTKRPTQYSIEGELPENLAAAGNLCYSCNIVPYKPFTGTGAAANLARQENIKTVQNPGSGHLLDSMVEDNQVDEKPDDALDFSGFSELMSVVRDVITRIDNVGVKRPEQATNLVSESSRSLGKIEPAETPDSAYPSYSRPRHIDRRRPENTIKDFW